MNRSDVTFRSVDADCAAWLYRPAGPSEGRGPLVVMAHGLSATREQRLPAYAERFCAAGLGVLLFDYRGFGASAGEPRQVLDVPSQLADYAAAVAYARGLDWVDPDRVAVFGSSFSGGHALAVAARDPRVAAVVSQCPFTDSLASIPTLGLVNLLKAPVFALRDELARMRGLAPVYIPAVGPPGTFAVMTTPDSEPGFAAMNPPGSLWVNQVAARIALRLMPYRPGRAASRIACPVLFCVCETDSLAPARQTLRHAAKAPRGEIKRYPFGHFDIYVGEPFEQAVADQTEFLVRVLAPQPPAGGTATDPATLSTAPVT